MPPTGGGEGTTGCEPNHPHPEAWGLGRGSRSRVICAQCLRHEVLRIIPTRCLKRRPRDYCKNVQHSHKWRLSSVRKEAAFRVAAGGYTIRLCLGTDVTAAHGHDKSWKAALTQMESRTHQSACVCRLHAVWRHCVQQAPCEDSIRNAQAQPADRGPPQVPRPPSSHCTGHMMSPDVPGGCTFAVSGGGGTCFPVFENFNTLVDGIL